MSAKGPEWLQEQPSRCTDSLDPVTLFAAVSLRRGSRLPGMSSRRVLPSRSLPVGVAVTIGLAAVSVASSARADFSSPPESPYRDDEELIPLPPDPAATPANPMS